MLLDLRMQDDLDEEYSWWINGRIENDNTSENAKRFYRGLAHNLNLDSDEYLFKSLTQITERGGYLGEKTRTSS